MQHRLRSASAPVLLMRRLTVFVLLGILLAPLAASAQEDPPLPRPRIERDNAAASQDVTEDEETERNRSNPALDALADALRARGENPTAPVAPGPPQPVTLSAKISDDGVVIPDGLVWRIFDSHVDESGQFALLAKSDDSVAVFNLPPGEYLVHVAYGRSQASDTLDVEKGVNNKTIVLDSGGLRLNAAVTGDIPIPAADLRFEIYTSGDGQDHVLVARNVAPGDVVHLNAGVYEVVSHFGKVNAEVKADLRVDPGQLTDATLYHKARKIALKLASEVGGEAIADVDWSIKNSKGEKVYSYFGAFPGCILAEGNYTVFAKRGETVYNRDFSVTPGKPQEVEVLTSVYEGG